MRWTQEIYEPWIDPHQWKIKILQANTPDGLEKMVGQFLTKLSKLGNIQVHHIQYAGRFDGKHVAMVTYIQYKAGEVDDK